MVYGVDSMHVKERILLLHFFLYRKGKKIQAAKRAKKPKQQAEQALLTTIQALRKTYEQEQKSRYSYLLIVAPILTCFLGLREEFGCANGCKGSDG